MEGVVQTRAVLYPGNCAAHPDEDEVAKRWNRRWGVSSLGTPAANPVNTKSDQADNEAQDRNALVRRV
jgi:hypothetical protein